LDPPIISNVSPAIAPYGDYDISLMINGGEFDPAYEYFCQFKVMLTFLNETKAYFVTNNQIKCVVRGNSLIRHQEYVTIRVMMKDLAQTYSYMLPGTARVLFYDPPHISRIEPQSGDIAGGTEVYIEGYNFDVSYGGIWCKFGQTKVEALSIEQFKLIKCTAPASAKRISNDAKVSVSIDGINFYFGQFNREVFF
jgi:IPT/TIG domain